MLSNNHSTTSRTASAIRSFPYNTKCALIRYLPGSTHKGLFCFALQDTLLPNQWTAPLRYSQVFFYYLQVQVRQV